MWVKPEPFCNDNASSSGQWTGEVHALGDAVAITVTLESDIGKALLHPSPLHTPVTNFYIDGIFSSRVIGENISIAGIPLIPML